MIYLLYGPDTYRSRKKLNEIIEEYRKKASSDLSFHRFDAEENGLTALTRVLDTSSLFSPRKLVVVENALGDQGCFEILARHLKKAKESRDTFLVIWEQELGGEKAKRLKEISPQVNKIQEFKLFASGLLTRWIADEARERGLRLSGQDWVYLQSLGGNLWAVSNELDKLYVSGGRGARQTAADTSLFQLGDAFFTAKKRAFKGLMELFDQGHDEHRVFSYLSSHTRSLLTIKHCLEKRVSVPGFCKIHPFVVKKTTPWLVSYSSLRLKNLLSRFLEEDYGVKVGLRSPKDSLFRLLMH